MIRQICNVKLQDTANIRYTELLARLGIEDLDLILKERRLRWYGHVERSNGVVKTAFDMQTVGKRGPGRPKITWKQLTERDCSEWKLSALNPYDSHTWRSGVRSAMSAASQLPGRGPTVVDIAPVPAPGLRSFKNGLEECDYPRSTTERARDRPSEAREFARGVWGYAPPSPPPPPPLPCTCTRPAKFQKWLGV